MKQCIVFILGILSCISLANCQSDKHEINPTLKENLNGVWASDEYRETLFRTNSKTKTLKEYTFYTDIVFDQDSTLRCDRPDFMEENYLILKPDSTIWSYFDTDNLHKLISVGNDKLVIRDAHEKDHSFTRTKAEANLNDLSSEVNEGSHAIENSWLSGSRTFESKSQNFELVINNDGTVNSDQQIQKVRIFSYMNEDLLCFDYADESHKEYVIKSCSEKEMKLHEIHELYEEDQPIRYKRKFATLSRK